MVAGRGREIYQNVKAEICGLHRRGVAPTMRAFGGVEWMRRAHFWRERPPLLTIYEHNYMAFRLVLPVMPEDEAWYALKADGRPDVFLRRLSAHPYTSEWLLAHRFPGRIRPFAPDYTIRIYHDARLAEAMIDPAIPIRAQRERKYALNRALCEWLDYCRRYGYRLAGVAEMAGGQ